MTNIISLAQEYTKQCTAAQSDWKSIVEQIKTAKITFDSDENHWPELIDKLYQLEQCNTEDFLKKNQAPDGKHLDQGCIGLFKQSFKEFVAEDKPLYERITSISKFFNKHVTTIDYTYHTRIYAFLTEYLTIIALTQLMEETESAFKKLAENIKSAIKYEKLNTDFKKFKAADLEKLLTILDQDQYKDDPNVNTIKLNLQKILTSFTNENSNSNKKSNLLAQDILRHLEKTLLDQDIVERKSKINKYLKFKQDLLKNPNITITQLLENIKDIDNQLYSDLSRTIKILQQHILQSHNNKYDFLFIEDPNNLRLNDLAKLNDYLQLQKNNQQNTSALANIKQAVDQILDIFDYIAPKQTMPDINIAALYQVAILDKDNFLNKQSRTEKLDEGCVTLFSKNFAKFIAADQPLSQRIAAMQNFFSPTWPIDQTYYTRVTRFFAAYVTINTFNTALQKSQAAFEALDTNVKDDILINLDLETFDKLKEADVKKLLTILDKDQYQNNSNVTTFKENVRAILKIFSVKTMHSLKLQKSTSHKTGKIFTQNLLRRLQNNLLNPQIHDRANKITKYLQLEQTLLKNPNITITQLLENIKPIDIQVYNELQAKSADIQEKIAKSKSNELIFIEDTADLSLNTLTKLNYSLVQVQLRTDNPAVELIELQTAVDKILNIFEPSDQEKPAIPDRDQVPSEVYLSEIIYLLHLPQNQKYTTLDWAEPLLNGNILQISLIEQQLQEQITELEKKISDIEQGPFQLKFSFFFDSVKMTEEHTFNKILRKIQPPNINKKYESLQELHFLKTIAYCLANINYNEINAHQKYFNFSKNFYSTPYNSAKKFLADPRPLNSLEDKQAINMEIAVVEFEHCLTQLQQTLNRLHNKKIQSVNLGKLNLTSATLHELENAITVLKSYHPTKNLASQLELKITAVKNIFSDNSNRANNSSSNIAQHRYWSNPNVPFLDKIEGYCDNLLIEKLAKQSGTISCETLAKTKASISFIKQHTEALPQLRCEQSYNKLFTQLSQQSGENEPLNTAIEQIREFFQGVDIQDHPETDIDNSTWHEKIASYLQYLRSLENLPNDTTDLINTIETTYKSILDSQEGVLPLYARLEQLKYYVVQLRLQTFKLENRVLDKNHATNLGAITNDLNNLNSNMEQLLSLDKLHFPFPIDVTSNTLLQKIFQLEGNNAITSEKYTKFLKTATVWELYAFQLYSTKNDSILPDTWKEHVALLQKILSQCPEFKQQNADDIFKEIIEHLQTKGAELELEDYKIFPSIKKLQKKCRDEKNPSLLTWLKNEASTFWKKIDFKGRIVKMLINISVKFFTKKNQKKSPVNSNPAPAQSPQQSSSSCSKFLSKINIISYIFPQRKSRTEQTNAPAHDAKPRNLTSRR